MSVHVIYYQDGAKMMRPVLNREEYMALRDSEQNRRADKKHMVQMNYSCLPCGATIVGCCGPLKGSKTPSNTVGMDVDILRNDPSTGAGATETEEEYKARLAAIPEKVLAMKEELGLLMLEASASKGFHIVFRRHTELSQEENLRWASELLGVEFDKGAKDITRVFFTPADKLLYLDDEVFEVRNTRYEVQGTKDEVQGTKCEGRGAKDEVRGTSKVLGAEDLSLGPIPYSVIIERWWKDVKGHQPYVGERHTCLLDLCKNLAYITEFDRERLLQIMPRLDIPEEELVNIVDDTLKFVAAHRSTKVPYSMYKLLKQLEQEYETSVVEDEAENDGGSENNDDDVDAPTMPDSLVGMLPPGIREYVAAAPPRHRAAYCHSLLVEWATIISRIKATYLDGVEQTPSLLCCVVGPPSTGKRLVERTSTVILRPLQEQDARMEMLEDQWDDAVKQLGGGAKEAPLRPKLPKLFSDGDITAPEMLQQLKFNKQSHFIICSDEIDSLTKSEYASWKILSEFFRKSFDNSRFGQQRAGRNSVRGHAPVYCNLLTACTEDRLMFYFKDHVENGLASRMIISPIRSRLGELMPPPVLLKPAALRRIASLQQQALSDNFSIQETVDDDGTPHVQFEPQPVRTLNMNFLNAAINDWLVSQAMLCRKEGSQARDQFRKRAAVIAFRSGMVAFWLFGAKHTSAVKERVIRLSLWMADTVLENNLHYFGGIVEKKSTSLVPYSNQGVNFAGIYDSLGGVFDADDVIREAERVGVISPARHIICLWKRGALIRKFQKRYYKIGSAEELALSENS